MSKRSVAATKAANNFSTANMVDATVMLLGGTGLMRSIGHLLTLQLTARWSARLTRADV